MIPLGATIVMLCMMFRPAKNPDSWGVWQLYRVLWTFPILITWVVYLAVMLMLKD